jgi:NitT/TauT family transport system substrate-binding protein
VVRPIDRLCKSLIAVAVGALLTTLTACGSDAKDSSSGGPAEISFVGNYSLSYLPVYIAQNEGYFKSEDLSMNRLPDVASDQIGQLVLGGKADIAAIGSTTAYTLASAGRPIKSVAVLTPNLVFALSLTTKTVDKLAAKGVTPESPIEQKVQALKGLTLAVTPQGTTTDVLMRATLEEYGVDPDKDVTLQPLQDPASMQAAARAGRIDGFLFTPPVSLAPTADGTGKVWIDYASSEVEDLANIYQLDVITTEKYLAAHRDRVEGFLRALWRANGLINSDQAKAGEAAREPFKDLDDALFDESITFVSPAFAGGMVPTEKGFNNTKAFADKTAENPLKVTFDQMYEPKIAEETKP